MARDVGWPKPLCLGKRPVVRIELPVLLPASCALPAAGRDGPEVAGFVRYQPRACPHPAPKPLPLRMEAVAQTQPLPQVLSSVTKQHAAASDTQNLSLCEKKCTREYSSSGSRNPRGHCQVLTAPLLCATASMDRSSAALRTPDGSLHEGAALPFSAR